MDVQTTAKVHTLQVQCSELLTIATERSKLEANILEVKISIFTNVK